MSRVRNTPFTCGAYPATMATVMLRLALPDRPGALGAVASRIGAVRGDVRSIDIVSRREGYAVDELVVDIGHERHLSLMLDEIAEVDGVRVEDVQVVPPELVAPRPTAVDAAVAVMASPTTEAVLRTVVEHAVAATSESWAVIMDADSGHVLAAAGRPPAAPWLAAYVAGAEWFDPAVESVDDAQHHRHPVSPATRVPPLTRPSASTRASASDRLTAVPQATVAGRAPSSMPRTADWISTCPPAMGATAGDTPARVATSGDRATKAPAPDIASVRLAAWDLVLVAGRSGGALTHREHRHLADLARLADARWSDLASRASRLAHPSGRSAPQDGDRDADRERSRPALASSS